MTTAVTVREVNDAKGLDVFLKVPFSVFADDGAWIAPLFFERKEHLSEKKNPYFEHAEAQLFIAERDGVAVGRISAQIDRLHLERYDDATGQFGFLDAIDDAEVFAALVEAASGWLLARGIKRMQGPFSFSINEETGMLVDGFDTPPCVMMPHGKPYYSAQLEALGFAKAMDVLAYDYDGTIEPPRSMLRMVEKAKRSGDLEIRPFNKKNLTSDLSLIIDIFNDAWTENWNFVPMTEAEIKALGDNLKLLVKDDYIAIAFYQGEPAAMAVSLPNINEWVAGLNGRLLPFGWAKILWRMFSSPPKSVRMPLMGVKKKFQGTAVGSALAIGVVDEVRRAHLARGTKRGELSWILETNAPMCSMLEALGAVPYKTYRVYEREIG